MILNHMLTLSMLCLNMHPSDENKGLFNAIFNSDKSKGNTSLGARGFWGVIRGKVQQLISAFVSPLM